MYRGSHINGRNTMENITEKDRKMAKMCLDCKVCSQARTKQKGLAYWFVKMIEGSICPYCKAYEKVYGKKAHEPVPSSDAV